MSGGSDISRRLLVTGGSGFIGSAVIRHSLAHTKHEIVNVDKLTYAANVNSVGEAPPSDRYRFEQVDICDKSVIEVLLARWRPDTVLHLAAESHVDRSIDGPAPFIQTNVVGTYSLLEATRKYWLQLSDEAKARFRLCHVSTDEVFGALSPQEAPFSEMSPYAPSSPYAATKAASDHLVRAWGRTYALPVIVSNCSNNYGPYQFPEKLIPVVILAALEGRPIPVYGKGEQVRDWLFVEDHVRALLAILERGKLGETYAIGGGSETSNIDLVRRICRLVDELAPGRAAGQSERLIAFTADRPGHDFRYAIDSGKIRRELGWRPLVTLDEGLRRTVSWYLENRWWWQAIREHEYGGERLGLGAQRL